MPAAPSGTLPDLSTPACRRIYNRVRELRATRKQWADRLATTTNAEERENILRTIEGLDNSLQMLEEELHEEGCYHSPPSPNTLLKITGIEVTQSTQYFSVEGSGAGAANSVPLIAYKPLLARVYLQSLWTDGMSITGRILVMVFNRNTLKYDILRRGVEPMQTVSMAGSSASRRRALNETLNFLIPAADCYGRLQLSAQAWVAGHYGEPIYSADNWERIEFNTRRTPIIHCFRMRVSRTVPGTTTPTQLAAPSDADCRRTIDLARRLLPVPDLDVRDRGERAFAGALETFPDYDAVRADILAVRNGTTPTPQDHEIYVAMLPTHANASGIVWGNALTGSIESIVFNDDMFAHELGHLVIPGDDHVSDTACALTSQMTQVDPNYPDYPNAIQRSGIGEWGVDLEQSPPTLFSPERPEIMSYCGGTKWVSPYNYLRAFHGDLLDPFTVAPVDQAAAHKLLLSFRIYRDGRVEFQWAVHLPGEPGRYTPKGMTEIVVELYNASHVLLASLECHHTSDRPNVAPYEDFQEVLPWFEEIAYVLVVRCGEEIARWPIEDAASSPLVSDLTLSADGASNIVIKWNRPNQGPARLHFMLRYTPDDGKTWIPLASGSDKTQVEVDSMLLRGVQSTRFQLALSTGFRTSFVESRAVAGPTFVRELRIIEPEAETHLVRGDAVRLLGETTTRLDGRDDSMNAYWSSNRDGFLADGLRAQVTTLSVGRHLIRLDITDGSGRTLTQSVVVRVQEQSGEP